MAGRRPVCRAINAEHTDYNMELYYRTNAGGVDASIPFGQIGNLAIGLEFVDILRELGHDVDVIDLTEMLEEG